jgi:oligoendopeptidase F
MNAPPLPTPRPWTELEPEFRALLAAKPQGEAELEQAIHAWDDLAAHFQEGRYELKCSLDRHTDDEDLRSRVKDFEEGPVTEFLSLQDAWCRKLLEHEAFSTLESRGLSRLGRYLRADRSCFAEENLPLQAEVDADARAYQAANGNLSVDWEGEQVALPALAGNALSRDRDLRERSWRAETGCLLSAREELDGIHRRLVAGRNRLAKQAGYPNHERYHADAARRFDYGRPECDDFWQTIQDCVAPLQRELWEERKTNLGVDALRPWDITLDPSGLPRLQPFTDAEDLMAKGSAALARLDHESAGVFERMRQAGRLDLDSRRHKAPGGYHSARMLSGVSFILMNSSGVPRNVTTLFHETGHALHSWRCRTQPVLEYRRAPTEFAEAAAMTMELFAHEVLDGFYEGAELRRAKHAHVSGIVGGLLAVGQADQFEQWAFEHPDATAEEKDARWLELSGLSRPGLDVSGIEQLAGAQWRRIPHFFTHPRYYISYGIARVASLQIWKRASSDRARAFDDYRRALSAGGSLGLKELFECAGLPFDFSPAAIAPLMDDLREELAALRG